jgi:hypothetical protein
MACWLAGIPVIALAQDCQHFLLLQKNKIIEMTIYNKKGEPNGKQVYTVSDVSEGGGLTTGGLVSELFDKKGKSMSRANGVVKCNGGVMLVDMKMLIPQQQQEQYASAQVRADNVYLEYPIGMKPGDALKDGNFAMDINNHGMQQTLTMVISDRKVEAQESVTTAAGTWNCYKISYKSRMTVKTGIIGIPFTFEGVEWYAPGFGVVKTQSKYGGTEITSIK